MPKAIVELSSLRGVNRNVNHNPADTLPESRVSSIVHPEEASWDPKHCTECEPRPPN
jgi:hypothetical protein